MTKDPVTTKRDDTSLEVSAQLKASFKKNTDGTESLQLTGRAPADISVIKDGKKKSVQGDHVITHALPKHGILKDFQNLHLDEIEDLSVYLREKRGGLYDFISAIAVLDFEQKDELYGALNQALDDYNERRFKIKKIEKLEESVRRNIPIEEQDDFFANFNQERDTNGRTMIDSVGRIAEAVMTFYNKTPLTAFLQIEGFADAVGSGGKVDSVLGFFDNFDVSKDKFSKAHLKVEREAVNMAQERANNATSLRSSARVSQANDATLEKVQEALAEKELGLDRAFLQESMRQLSGLIFYPEITSEEALKTHREQSGNKDRVRDNSQENLEAVIAKYIHILSAVYPELPEKLFNFSEAGRTFDETGGSKKDQALTFVTKEFTRHLITSSYQSKSGTHAKGWPTFAGDPEKMQEIGRNATALVHRYKALQEEHSYQKTDGFRSRSSSTTIEDANRRTIELVVDFIGKRFELEEAQLEGLVAQLSELDLTVKSDGDFKSKIIEKVEDFFEEGIEKEKMDGLRKVLFQEQSQNRGGR